jgi:hypothetical protein
MLLPAEFCDHGDQTVGLNRLYQHGVEGVLLLPRSTDVAAGDGDHTCTTEGSAAPDLIKQPHAVTLEQRLAAIR